MISFHQTITDADFLSLNCLNILRCFFFMEILVNDETSPSQGEEMKTLGKYGGHASNVEILEKLGMQ